MGFLKKLFGAGKIVKTECSNCSKVCQMIITELASEQVEVWFCTNCRHEERYATIEINLGDSDD